ncbi:MAG: aminotransferase class V-fold PLP-dependent enzyme [Eubacterium sp.]|nr:aminotransferase class V-fold PLP-dependent enzyme [Eubacterium sp.]
MREFLIKHANNEKASFHMPGHKGAEFFVRMGYGVPSGPDADSAEYLSLQNAGIYSIAGHDITEIPGADDLRHPDGIIKAITDRYAALYGSRKAFISVNGSSALIMASIMACIRPGHKLLAAADSHISVKNGAELAGIETVYVEPQVIDPWGSGDRSQNTDKSVLAAPGSLAGRGEEGSLSIPGGLSAESIAEMLDCDPEIDAVILPSPNYFGIVSDIRSIAEEVHKRGKILIVDQAHGAHLKMFADGSLPAPAEECGADLVIVSTHKTMASFTQTAVANIFGGCVDPADYEKKLLMLESTSPSYLLMESLALNAEIMEKHGAELAESWRSDLDWFYENVKNIPKIRVITRASIIGKSDFDDSKIVIDFSGAGLTGENAEEILIENGIYPEFSTGSIVMLLTGIGNRRRDYEILIDALTEMVSRS